MTTACSAGCSGRLLSIDAVDLNGAHDLRHTLWPGYEDADNPAQVVDEMVDHQVSARDGIEAAPIGAYYRHTTPEMATRVVAAVEERLVVVVLATAEAALDQQPWSR